MRHRLDDSLPILGQAHDLAGFRAWAALDSGRLRDIPAASGKPDAQGWTRSPRLDRRFRLVRHPARPGREGYRLEHD
jgi:hypothetical protein